MKNLICGQVKNGKFEIGDGFKEFSKMLLEKYEGKELNIFIEKRRKVRSLRQNAYYFGLVLKSISDYTGYEMEDLHNHFKTHLLKKKVGNLDTHRSTTSLSTDEFTHFVGKVKEFAKQTIGLEILSYEEMIEEQMELANNNYKKMK